jgi:hypothetical protein
MAKTFSYMLFLRTTGVLAVREAAHFSAMPSHRGKVRPHERGALHAMVPRLYMCAVPFVARAERGSSAHSCERDRHAYSYDVQ